MSSSSSPTFTLSPVEQRELSILTSSVRRLLSDLNGYHEELKGNERKLDSLLADPKSESYDIKKSREFVLETDATIREITRKITDANDKLISYCDIHLSLWSEKENEQKWRNAEGKHGEVATKALDIISKYKEFMKDNNNNNNMSGISSNTKEVKDEKEAKTFSLSASPTSPPSPTYSFIGQNITDSSSPSPSLSSSLISLFSSLEISPSPTVSLSNITILLPSQDISHFGEFLQAVGRTKILYEQFQSQSQDTSPFLFIVWSANSPYSEVWSLLLSKLHLPSNPYNGMVHLADSVEKVKQIVQSWKEKGKTQTKSEGQGQGKK